MSEDVKMPTRKDALKSAAKKLIPGHGDIETLRAIAVSAGMFAYMAGVMVVRVVLFLAFPLSVLLLYPVIRANQRRWYRCALDEGKRRAELIADLTRLCQKPIDGLHDWAKPIPSADLYRAAAEAEAAEQSAVRAPK